MAFEEVMRARRALSTFTYEGTLSAERHLRRAVARDPDYARAYAELASAYVIRMENDWIVLSREDVDKAFHFAAKALELDPDLWFAHYSLGRLHSVASTGDVETGLRHLRTAMALQPENDDARIYFAVVTAMSGHLGEGLAIFESVMATHPQPPFWYYLGLGNALFHLHRYDEAAEVISTCLQQMPNSPYCLRIQIATLTRMGRLDDAAWAKEEYAILGHETTLDAVMQTAIERDPAMRRHLRNSYRLAGFDKDAFHESSLAGPVVAPRVPSTCRRDNLCPGTWRRAPMHSAIDGMATACDRYRGRYGQEVVRPLLATAIRRGIGHVGASGHLRH